MRVRLPQVGRRAWILFGVLLGTTLGVGTFTFVYAEGLSYLSSDPQACANCHIMRPQLEGWQKASHHSAATCVDCHLPAKGVAKTIVQSRSVLRMVDPAICSQSSPWLEALVSTGMPTPALPSKKKGWRAFWRGHTSFIVDTS